MQSISRNRGWAGLVLVALAFSSLACEREAVEPEAPDAVEATTPDLARAMNTLTQDEQAEGWELLFDGDSFEGWRGFRQDSVIAAACADYRTHFGDHPPADA